MTRYYLIKKTISLLDFFPFSVFLQMFYKSSLHFASIFIRRWSKDVKIWPRNSYISKSIKPGWSDIDLTIFATSNQAASRSTKRWKFIRFINPLFHEVNVYTQNEIKVFLPFANFFEVQRDSTLCKHIAMLLPTNNLKEQAITYLLRQLQSDFHNLNNNKINRELKWNRIFSNIKTQLDLPSSRSNQAIIDTVDKIIANWSSQAPSYQIFSGLNDFREGHSHEKIKDDNLFQALYPHLWVTSAIKYYPLFPENILTPTADQKLQSILIMQIGWEIWGLYTQQHIIADKISITNHLQYMKIILETLPYSNDKNLLSRESTVSGIEMLIQLIGK